MSGDLDNLEGRLRRKGRKPGAVDQSTKSIKYSFIEVYRRLGGDEGFGKWAMKNPGLFYKLFAKMLPREVELAGEGGQPLQIHVITGVPDSAIPTVPPKPKQT